MNSPGKIARAHAASLIALESLLLHIQMNDDHHIFLDLADFLKHLDAYWKL